MKGKDWIAGLLFADGFTRVSGDVLYYATSFFDHYVMDVSYSRPEAFYYWFYFVLMNAFWIAIPGGKRQYDELATSLEILADF